MKKIFILTLVIVSCFMFHANVFAQKKLKVITTLNYLKYVTQQVGADRVDVTALTNPKQDPHYVTTSPRMNQITNDADLFIENGLSLDLWAKNVIDASGNPSIQAGSPGHLIATVNVSVKELPTVVTRAWGDIHPAGNPHAWLDPFNIKIIAENISDRLKKIDPSNSDYYQKRLDDFKNRIDVAIFGEDLLKAIGKKAGDILERKTKNNELDDWLKSKKLDAKLGGWMKKALPLKGVKVVSYHKTYIYFADRFELDISGELEEKPGIPPPPQHRDAIVEQVKREGVKAILNDNFYSQNAAQYVADKTGAKVIITYIDVCAVEEVDTYEKLITYFIEKLTQAIQ